MSTKGAKKPSNRKRKIKKGKPKSDTNTPRKIKSKSNVLNKLKKKKKKSESAPKKNKLKSEDKSLNKIAKKKKSTKPRKSTFDPICNDSKSKIEIKPKRKNRRSSNIDSIKKQLLSQSNGHDKNMLPNSAKKIVKSSPPKKNKKQISKGQSLKKTKDFQYSYNYNVKASNSINPRRAISDMYGFGKKHKKKKTNEIIQPKPAKKKKKKSSVFMKQMNFPNCISKPKKKKTKDTQLQKHKNKHKLKKKPVQPSSTEKLNLFRRKPKTKTKKKELLFIGDYVRISDDKCGIIRYKGSLKNVTGIWYGIELLGNDKNGDCDGIFNGEIYFQCKSNNGIFIMYESIESKMKIDEIEKLLLKKKVVSKKRANSAMAFGKYKKKKDEKKISSKFSVNEKGKKVKDKKGRKGKKVKKKKNNKIKRSSTMDSDKENDKKLLSLSLKYSGDDNKNQKRKFKWDIPSKTPTFNGRHISNGDCELAALSLNTNVVNSGRISNKNCGETPKGTFSKSDNNLQNILHRGRKIHKSTNDDSDRKRTRSLSTTRGDKSWMTHQNKNGNSVDRIKQNILQQKQLDLEGLMAVKSNNKKNKKIIGKLFEKHIENAKIISAKGGIAIEADKSKLKERLKNEEEALKNAVNIVKDLGFLKYIKDNEIYSKIYIKMKKCKNEDDKKCEMDYDLFDMNNIDILSKFSGKTRDILSKVICKAIISISTIEILEMCNCDIDCDFIHILCDYLSVYYNTKGNKSRITIISLQSNPITDNGIISLTRLIRLNNKNLTTIKLQNNRKDISTLICQQICEALEDNQYIIKFEFEFRHYQWRDFRDKIVKRNFEKVRLNRLEMKKTKSV